MPDPLDNPNQNLTSDQNQTSSVPQPPDWVQNNSISQNDSANPSAQDDNLSPSFSNMDDGSLDDTKPVPPSLGMDESTAVDSNIPVTDNSSDIQTRILLMSYNQPLGNASADNNTMDNFVDFSEQSAPL